MNSGFRFGNPVELTRAEFVAKFGGIYEHSPWIAEQAYDQGLEPKDNQPEQLLERFAGVFNAASRDQKLGVINAHPDLAGKAAQAGQLTQASRSEQSGAGIDQLTAAEFKEFTELNNQYKKRFSFPFIMAVKGSNKDAILEGFRTRISNPVEDEFEQALQEINKIAAFRLAEL